jgi:chaperone BCS1
MQISQMGILNKISTHNVYLDVLICIILPILFKPLASWLNNLQNNNDYDYEYLQSPLRNLFCITRRHYRKLVYINNPSDFLESIESRYAHLAIMDMLNHRKSEWINFTNNCDVVVDRSFTGNGVIVTPPTNAWIPIGDNIRIMMTKKCEDFSGKTNRIVTHSYFFESTGPLGGHKIDTFLATSYKRFMENHKKLNRDGKLFMYIPQLNISASSIVTDNISLENNNGRSSKLKYEQYELKNQKHLHSNVFFPDRHKLITLLDTFTKKQGRYIIEGFPYQFGIMLHGLPGTGKTSIIKAIANHTKRHLIFIDLARVSSNQQLTQIMFEETRHIENNEEYFNMPPQDVIFVLEDVDAASNIVLQRHKKDGQNTQNTQNTQHTQHTQNTQNTQPSSGVTLAGLLNALDGPLDGPGRIIIMTSNYPEKLDRALVRPGRIDLQIGLTYMTTSDAVLMIEHYVTRRQLTDEEKAIFEQNYIPTTPAELQGICLGCEQFKAVIDAFTHKTRADTIQ